MEATAFSPRELQKALEAHQIPNAPPAVPTVVAVASAAGPPAVLPYARALDSEALSLPGCFELPFWPQSLQTLGAEGCHRFAAEIGREAP